MAKIFISYKYGDDQVSQDIDDKYWAIETDAYGNEVRETKATGRAYVNKLEEVLGKDNILKGEKQDESLEGKSEPQIWELLKPRVHDSSITLALITRGMKEGGVAEKDQWIPNEIRYSLWEQERGGKNSLTNGLLGVIVPDRNGNYDHVYGQSDCTCCQNIQILKKYNNPYLFEILKGNIFNKKHDNGRKCDGCSMRIYNGNHSYLKLVKWDEFIKDNNYEDYIKVVEDIKNEKDNYDIQKDF